MQDEQTVNHNNILKNLVVTGVMQDIQALKGNLPPSIREISNYSRRVLLSMFDGGKKYIDKTDIDTLIDDFSKLRDNPQRDFTLTQKARFLVTKLMGANMFLEATGQDKIRLLDK